jgi:hypothetical protein
MAWLEGETWAMEQGIDALLTLELYKDAAATDPWLFPSWDVNATVSDEKGRTVYPVTVDANPSTGVVRLILPEAIVNTLRVGRPYRYDCIMVAPGNLAADDHHLAAGPVTVALRTSRRDSGSLPDIDPETTTVIFNGDFL